jgi:hypothetical protein
MSVVNRSPGLSTRLDSGLLRPAGTRVCLKPCRIVASTLCCRPPHRRPHKPRILAGPACGSSIDRGSPPFYVFDHVSPPVVITTRQKRVGPSCVPSSGACAHREGHEPYEYGHRSRHEQKRCYRTTSLLWPIVSGPPKQGPAHPIRSPASFHAVVSVHLSTAVAGQGFDRQKFLPSCGGHPVNWPPDERNHV